MSSSILQTAPPKQRPRRLATKALIGLVAMLVVLLVIAHPLYTHLRSAGLLLRIQDPNRPGMLVRMGTYPVEEKLTTIPTAAGTIPARLYVPQGIAHAPGMVIVHGVHHLGIEEPRLVRFARAVSASGIEVLTPQLDSLADYRIDGESIALIGDSARSLSSNMGQKVGVLGLSFAGGLSLLAAADGASRAIHSFCGFRRIPR